MAATQNKHALVHGRYSAYQYHEKVDYTYEMSSSGYEWPKGAGNEEGFFPQRYHLAHHDSQCTMLQYMFDTGVAAAQ